MRLVGSKEWGDVGFGIFLSPSKALGAYPCYLHLYRIENRYRHGSGSRYSPANPHTHGGLRQAAPSLSQRDRLS